MTLRRVPAALAVSLWLVIVAVNFGLGLAGVNGSGGLGSGSAGTAGGGGTGGLSVANTVAFLVFVAAFSTVGALVAQKRPRHPIGWLLLVAAACYTIGGLGVSTGSAHSAPRPGLVMLAEWAGGWAWGLGVGFAVVALLVFPDGRLASRRWLPVLALTVAGMAAFVFGMGFGTATIGDKGDPNPFLISGPAGDVLRAMPDGFPLVLIGALLAVVSIVVRFRRARGVERQQIKWLTLTALLVGIAFAVALAPVPLPTDVGNALMTSALASLPIAIGIAVLRHGLFDIDRIISRTLSYATLSAILAAIFTGLVLGLQLALSSVVEGNALAVAASTLVVASLFQPIRARLQRHVDRRFNRARYDAERTVQRFVAGVRDEVDLDRIGMRMADAVGESLEPSRVSIWVRETTG